MLPEGQAAVRALRVSPGLQGTPSILRWMARIYSAAGMKIYGCKVFSKTRLDPCRLILGYNALAMRRHCPRVYAAPITVSLPQCIPMIDMLVNGIIRSVSAGVRFLQRAIMLSVGLHALVGIVHVTTA